MSRVLLSEKWYDFIRYYCKEGYIDIWSGDLANNPNNEKKNTINLNTSSHYFRLNDSEWISGYENFKKHFNIELVELYQDFSAEEIWNAYKTK